MKILFSTSIDHFKNSKHSAGVLARLYYEAIRKLGEVDVIDSRDVSLKGREYDLLLGLPRNFNFLTKNNKFKLACCTPNICEGRQLKTVLHEEARKLGCKVRDAYAPDSYYHADHLFVIGGEYVLEGFTKAGISFHRITPLYWGSGLFEFKHKEKNKKTIFLHSATTLGLRKGFWHVVNDFKKTLIDAELWIIGRVQKESFWFNFAQAAREDSRIKILGWVENTDPKYKDYLYRSDYVVFPSLGEGQPGTVTEAMEAGCIPIVSREAGIDYTPFKYERGNKSVFEYAHLLSQENFTLLQQELERYVKHTYDNERFIKTVRDKILELMP